MPLLGKRKYINDKIEKLINKLDTLGYDTTQIKRRFYDIEDEEEEETYDSAGSLLPYRNKINETLKMIEELIMPGNYQQQQQQQQNYPIQFKNDLIERVRQSQQPPPTQQNTNLSTTSFSLGYPF
jgi:hypothetical protein